MRVSLLAIQRDALWLANRFSAWAGLSREIYFEQRIAEYRRIWEGVAAAREATFVTLARDLWEIGAGGARVRIRNHEVELDNPVTLALAGRKPVVHGLLRAAGIPVPEHLVFGLDRLDEGRRFARRYPEGVVVKPANGYGGKGVTTHVTPGEVRRAAVRASVYDSELLIERMIPGESYRILVLEGRVVDAVWRRGPRVVGDGASTVRQLLGAENERRAAARLPRLDIDRDARFTLGYQGLTLETRPVNGRTVVLKSMAARAGRYADVRTVYTDPALEHLHPSIARDAEVAADLVGSDFLGVDVITPDPTVPLRESGGVINEVNTTPALHHHYDQSREPYPRVAVSVLEALLRRAAARRPASRVSPAWGTEPESDAPAEAVSPAAAELPAGGAR